MKKTVEGSGQPRPTAQQIADDAERLKELEDRTPEESIKTFGFSDKITECLEHKELAIPRRLRLNFPGYTRADLRELFELANNCKLPGSDDIE